MDEAELRAYIVAITTISLFIPCIFFFEGEKKRESNGDKNFTDLRKFSYHGPWKELSKFEYLIL